MAEDQGEKTEQATEGRREEFRKRGQVAHSKELGSAFILLMASGAVFFLSQFFLQHLQELFNHTFGLDLVKYIREGQFMEALSYAFLKAIILIGPVVVIGAVIGSLSSVMQVGFLNVEDALNPDLNKLNPLEGFKRIMSLRGVMEAVKAVFKLVLISSVVYMMIKGELKSFGNIQNFSIAEILSYIGHIASKLFFAVGIVMLALSVGDYFFQRWDLERKMMMTKQEVKEEVKQREGDPLIKARMRKAQRDILNKRMMEAIPKADVVVTNPTHIACVLKYSDNLPAPQLVAKGADHMAERIKAIAKEHNIPIIENKPLARTIYKTMKIGQVIPRELFVAVAEVLSYVYKLRRKARA